MGSFVFRQADAEEMYRIIGAIARLDDSEQHFIGEVDVVSLVQRAKLVLARVSKRYGSRARFNAPVFRKLLVVQDPHTNMFVVLAERSIGVAEETSLNTTLVLANEVCMAYRIPADQLVWYERNEPGARSSSAPSTTEYYEVRYTVADGWLIDFQRQRMTKEELADKTCHLVFAKRLDPVF